MRRLQKFAGKRVMAVRQFIEKFGAARYREVPKMHLFRDGHRKAIALEYAFDISR